MDTLNRIIDLMKLKNCDNQMLASALGLNRQVVTDWKAERSKSYMKYLPQIADYFGVTVDYLLGKTDNKESKSTRRPGVRIPVYGNVAAGVPILAIENYDSDDPDDWEEITEKMASTGEYFALRIHGDSMEPKISNGDIVIVRVQQTIESGETAIVRINGDEATCKKLKRTPEGIMLISTNPAYEPMFFTPKQVQELPVEIIGKVVELRAKF